MGTIPYMIKYRMYDKVDYKSSIDSILVAFNQSMSTYIEDSEISIFNISDTIVYRNDLFPRVLATSKVVFNVTQGAFDPTIGPLVNAWGFGPSDRVEEIDQEVVDSLLSYVGFEDVVFNSEFAVKKKGIYLDFSAIAKGLAIDLISEFLETKQIEHYMVEIGGEVRTMGTNQKDNIWTIGIEDPLVDRDERKIMSIAQLENRSVATSGNYRNYYELDGKIYAHIIDPRTGFTSDESILSASVFAPDCMTADAYATAFMVLGMDESLRIISNNPDLDAMLVYRENDDIKTLVTEGIAEYITQQ